MSEYIVIGTIIAAFAVAAVLSYFFTPPVKNFAHKVGAIDVLFGAGIANELFPLLLLFYRGTWKRF